MNKCIPTPIGNELLPFSLDQEYEDLAQRWEEAFKEVEADINLKAAKKSHRWQETSATSASCIREWNHLWECLPKLEQRWEEAPSTVGIGLYTTQKGPSYNYELKTKERKLKDRMIIKQCEFTKQTCRPTKGERYVMCTCTNNTSTKNQFNLATLTPNHQIFKYRLSVCERRTLHGSTVRDMSPLRRASCAIGICL